MSPTTKITKGTLSFVAKAWWTLVRHRLSSSMGDNMLSPDRAELVTSIMEFYDINVAKILARSETRL